MNDYVATKKATDVKPGDRVVEADGAFFEVKTVEVRGKSVYLELANVNGYMLAPKTARVGRNSNVRVLAEDA